MVKQRSDKKERPFSKVSELFLLGVILVSTWLRGLFFPAELFPMLIIISLLFILYLWSQQPGEYIYLDYGVLLFGIIYTISLLHPVVYHDALVGWITVGSYVMVYFMAARWGENEHFLGRLA
ncbi:MAG: hypothetical protein ACM3NT_09175 [Methylocystaceae bacterium]